jgi:putative DNA primase/helicase
LKDGKINRKRDVEIVPPDQVCPDDIYNAWRPFAMELVDEYTEDKKVIDFMKNHIEILCDHNKECFDYFIKWIAMCIQFPSIKLPMPVFVSAEGAGKGSILKLFGSVLGGSKILQTQEPSQEVWGSFNSLMLNSYLVCLDEINKKEMSGSEGKIKGLITEPTMNINDKGKSRFPVKSYHKFIAFSNPDAYGNEPMTTTAGDRRKFFVMCSDELVGNKPYFNTFNEYLEDQNAMKNVYEYFKSLKDVKTLLSDALPESDFHKELKAIAVPPLRMFLTDYLKDNMFEKLYGEGVPYSVTTDDLYTDLKPWCERTGIRYECNKLKFGCRLANMKLKGMSKVQVGRTGIKGWSFTGDTKVALGINID